MSDSILFADFPSRGFVSAQGGTPEQKTFVLGDHVSFGLNIVDRSDGTMKEKQLHVRTLRASLGKTLEPPTRGTFRLRWRTVIPAHAAVVVVNGDDEAQYLTQIIARTQEGDVWRDQSQAGSFDMESSSTALASPDWSIVWDGTNATITALNGHNLEVFFEQFVGGIASKGDNSTTEGESLQFTTSLSLETTADQLKTALNAITPVDISEAYVDAVGTWTFRTVDGSRLTGLAVAPDYVSDGNLLYPVSFVRIRAQQGASLEWWHEIRLIQTPYAFSGSFERVLPEAPTVILIREGSPQEPGVTANTNEVQALHVPVEFNGTFFIRWNFRTTTTLGIQDGIEEIEAALNAMFTDGKKRFSVTNPEEENAYVEFVGELAAADQPLMEVVVHSFKPGVITFDLDLDKKQAHDALRSVAELKDVPFEVELEIVDSEDDIIDPEVPGRMVTFQMPVKFVREQIFDELAVVPAINWLRPPQPRNYVPFTPDQIITGTQYYTSVRGDGSAREFVLDHGLATDNLAAILVRQNQINGAVLVLGEDYEVEISNADTVVVTLTGAATPALNGLAITLATAGPASAFQAHTHAIGQIIGLQDALDALAARLTAIEDRLPFTSPALPDAEAGEVFEMLLPDRFEVFPGRFKAGHDQKTLALPERLGILPPALHDATITAHPALDITIDPATVAGQVYQFTSVVAGAELVVPGGYGFKSTSIVKDQFFGSDGRAFYPVTRDAATNSFFPTLMERELFVLFVNENMFRPGQELTATFELMLKTMAAATRVQFLLNIEVGTAPQDTTPSPVGVNLKDIIWSATPLLSLRLLASDLEQRNKLGVTIARTIANEFKGSVLTYNTWTAATVGSEPASANFVLRARLLQFDTENSVRNKKGAVAFSLTNGKASIE